MGEEGGEGHENGDPERAARGEAEDGTQDPVEESQPDGMDGAVQGPADQGAQHHDHADDEQEGGNLREGEIVDKAFDKRRHMAVVPAGQQNSGDQAAEGEEFDDDSAQEGHDGRVDKQRDEKTVEEVNAALGISEIGTAGNQTEGFE